jgi:DNA topoisomerase-1
VRIAFRGKAGQRHERLLEDPRLARTVRRCQDLPGQCLFQYVDEAGARVNVGSADVNTYLREISGGELTAKVFRTWAGTVRALEALRAVPADGATKAALVEVVKAVAAQLGNTPAVCRKSYIHPDLIESWEKGEFHAVLARVAPHARASGGLSADEKLTLLFLAAWQRRKPKSLKQALARSVAKVKKAS